jgi:GxxExxY protein
MDVDEVTGKIIGAAIEVHRTLGPGLLESVYDECMRFELASAGLAFRHQYPIPIEYNGRKLSGDYRIDFLVEGLVVVELKAVERLQSVHEAQLLTYLRLTRLQVGLLVNFNTDVRHRGVKRLVNNYRDSAPSRLCG